MCRNKNRAILIFFFSAQFFQKRCCTCMKLFKTLAICCRLIYLGLFEEIHKMRIWYIIIFFSITKSLIRPKTNLNNPFIFYQLNILSFKKNLSRLFRPLKRTCKCYIKPYPQKSVPCLLCQLYSVCIKRNIHSSLQPFFFIPFCLSMSNHI